MRMWALEIWDWEYIFGQTRACEGKGRIFVSQKCEHGLAGSFASVSLKVKVLARTVISSEGPVGGDPLPRSHTWLLARRRSLLSDRQGEGLGSF